MYRADLNATHELNNIKYGAGRVLPFGASVILNGVNFSIVSKNATKGWLCLFYSGEKEPFVEIPLDEFRFGNVYSVVVFDLDIENIEYAYRFDGPYDPSKGLLFDKEKYLIDPYAKAVTGRIKWGIKDDESDSRRSRVIYDDFDWQGDKLPQIPLKDLIIYEAHVRGMTCDDKNKYPGTFAGLREKIPYLKELGINCIELMPIFEFDELENPREYDGEMLKNYWGYSTVCFFAPKAGYAYSSAYKMEVDELKAMIRDFHKNGIEVILDVVFNHTAEGNENGPYISYKGIDNAIYYLLTEDGQYYNFSGCGNTINCNNAMVRDAIVECLRYWAADYHIDGFRFDLAAILSRDKDGTPMANPPLLEELAHDPVLGNCKLIAEAWDAGGLYQVGSFSSCKRWAEWNGRYRDCVRRFVKGHAEVAGELFERITGSKDIYGTKTSEASINFITCHDGFTLYDLVSYNEKHNLQNGEDNRDGCNNNDSWNCGVEGDTNDREVLDLRYRQMKNMATILFLSRGVVMMLAGDEFGNSQKGNNNTYCQDNKIGWVNWENLKNKDNKAVFDYFRRLISFRKNHPVLRNAEFFEAVNATGYPEVSFHGLKPWEFNRNSNTLTFAVLFVEDHVKYETEKDAFIYFCINEHWEEHEFELPIVPKNTEWKIELATSKNLISTRGYKKIKKDERIIVNPRSVVVLVAK